jgi:hypothetical protein
VWVGAEIAARLGRSVAGLGDLDGDGRPEVLIGVPQGSTEWVQAARWC